MENKPVVRARVFYGIMSPRDGEQKDPTKCILRFYSSDDATEKEWTKLYNIEKTPHPERFLIKHGFEPSSGNLYQLKQ